MVLKGGEKKKRQSNTVPPLAGQHPLSSMIEQIEVEHQEIEYVQIIWDDAKFV